MITAEADLTAAVEAGGDIICDSRTIIELTDTIQLTRPARLVGGHFIRRTGPAFEITSSNVELGGVHIHGGGDEAGYDGTQKLVYAHPRESEPLTDIAVHHCVLTGSRGDNVWLERCQNSTVHDNTITRYLYSGVMVISGDGITVNSNIVADAPLTDGVANTYGIALTDLTNEVADRSQHVTVTGNHVSLVDWEGIDTHGGDALTITGNTVIGCPRGVALVVGNETRTTPPANCLVSGNTIDVRGARRTDLAGVFLGGVPNHPASATVTGNQIIGYDTPIYANLWDRARTYIGANSEPFVPWTGIQLNGEYRANATYPPQYRVDGNTVYLRGGVIPASGVGGNSLIGTIPSAAAWPTTLSFVGYAKGSNPGAGNGMIAVDTSGAIKMLYASGSDAYTYFLSGTYEAA